MPNVTQKAMRQVKNQSKQVFEPKTPIASDMFLPNHSGVTNHPEMQGIYVLKAGDTMTGGLAITSGGLTVDSIVPVGSSLTLTSNSSPSGSLSLNAGPSGGILTLNGSGGTKISQFTTAGVVKNDSSGFLTGGNKVDNTNIDLTANYTWSGSHTFLQQMTATTILWGDEFTISEGLILQGDNVPGDIKIQNNAVNNDIIFQVSSGECYRIDTSASLHDFKSFNIQTTGSVKGASAQFTNLNAPGFVKNDASGNLSGAHSIDISSETNLGVSSPITLTGDTVGFSFSTNNTWTGNNIFEDLQIDTGTNVDGVTFSEKSLFSGALVLPVMEFKASTGGNVGGMINGFYIFSTSTTAACFFVWSNSDATKFYQGRFIPSSDIFEFNTDNFNIDFRVNGDTQNAVILVDASADEAIFNGGTKVDSSGDLVVRSRTDANRGSAGTAGRVIFNTDDGQLNIDDGTNWTLPNGTTT